MIKKMIHLLLAKSVFELESVVTDGTNYGHQNDHLKHSSYKTLRLLIGSHN